MSTRPVARRPTSVPAVEPPKSPPSAPTPTNSVTFGPRDRVIGQVYIEGDLRVAGVVEGEVEVTGDVEIDDMARVKASVSGGDVSVRGHLTGPVLARKRLVVARSGALIGDVRVARLVIQDGATFSGKISMGGASEAPARAKPAAAQPASSPEPEPTPAMAEVAAVKPAPEPAAVAVKPAPEPKPQAAVPAAPAPAKPAPAVVTPVVAARADGGKVISKAAGKAAGKAKAAPPPPKGKPKRR